MAEDSSMKNDVRKEDVIDEMLFLCRIHLEPWRTIADEVIFLSRVRHGASNSGIFCLPIVSVLFVFISICSINLLQIFFTNFQIFVVRFNQLDSEWLSI